jgi:phosphate transporter
MDNTQVRTQANAAAKSTFNTTSFAPVICVIVFGIIYLAPIWPLDPAAHSCLAILLTAAVCWGTECIPSYATAYLVAASSTWLRVGLADETSRVLTPALAKALAAKFTDPIIFVFLGSLTISAALSKLEITDRLSAFLLAHISPRPRIILLAVMCLNYIVAAFLSNVASTTLVLTFTLPIIRSLDPEDPFLKALLLGMAWSGNCGGMPTTIASPQNLLAISFINDGNPHPVSFIEWAAFGFPSSIVILFGMWVYLCLIFKPLTHTLPRLNNDKHFHSWGWKHSLATLTTVVTIVLWALNEQFQTAFGHVGITSLIPVICFFSVGILDGHDFGTLRWSTLVLMGGGLALGEAMTESGLLKLLAHMISEALDSVSDWGVLTIMLVFEAIVTSVVNHTSAAGILFPILAEIGEDRHKKGVFLTVAALMVSGSQLFHVSSFPNALIAGVQRHQRADPSVMSPDSILSGTDFFMYGWPTVVFALGVLASVAYGIATSLHLD